MKKRLLSLLVALCMAVTLLPVSAITAWAEESGQLKIVDGYPVGSGKNHDEDCSGDGWSYDGSTQTLDLHPDSPTEYDFFSIISGYEPITKCKLTIGGDAIIVGGIFDNTVINNGKISGGQFSSSSSLTNHGTITGGLFSSVSNESDGKIENGTFRSTVTNNGTIKGGIFDKKPAGDTVAGGYTLNVNFPENGNYGCHDAGINYFGNSGYVIPNSDHNTSITIHIFLKNSQAILFPIDVTFGDTNDTHCLLEDWAPSASVRYSDDCSGNFSVTFTAPPATAATVTLSMLTRLVIDENGYPVGTERGTRDYSGNGWNYNHTDKTLTLNPSTPTSYDFSGEKNALRPLNPNVQLVVESGAKLTGGAFKNMPTVKGAGTFKKVILNGTGSITAVNGLASGDWGNKLYAVKTGYNTITASEPIRDINLKAIYDDDVADLYPTQSDLSTILLNVGWLEYHGYIEENTDIVLNQGTYSTLKMADNGTPVIVNAPFEADAGYYTYYGDGWHIQKSSEGIGTLYLTGGNTYNFRYTDPVNKTGQLDAVICGISNEYGIIEDGIFNTTVANGSPNGDPTKTHKIEGGTFAAGLLYNDGTITGGAFNGKDSVLNKLLGSTVVSDTALSGDYRSVTVNDGAIVKVNDTLPLVYNETTHDLVQGSAWDLYSYEGTVLTVESNVDITNINGQEIGNAFTSYYPNGKTNKKVICFEMPDSDVELNSTKIVVPDPKPEPKPEPEPEAPTYTLTVKGGTFTYNGGEAMTSASVPVDAEVKVTLNQSAVPEGMVFDLWAMDEASLLGNPNVAYNAESFTIPANAVEKGKTVTVEAQYRDATIESEPSILGTAAIIGVAGAGTAVIVWQGYRIGMELYEKYFQPTPEEDAVVEPTLESQMTDPIS